MEAGFNNTTYNSDYYDDRNITEYVDITHISYTHTVTLSIVISISLPLVLVIIYALFSLVRQGQVASIYIINLLISDIVQLSCMIVLVSKHRSPMTEFVYYCGLFSSVGFMVCISLERYLVIVHPLWYRFKRTIKISVAVCAVVWVFPPVIFLIVITTGSFIVFTIVLLIFLIFPFPLFIFFLVRTLRALLSSLAVHSDEKRRIVGTLVVVLLIYTLLFLPMVISLLLRGTEFDSFELYQTSTVLVSLSPLADLLLYIFIRKQIMGNYLASVCCCIKESNDPSTSAVSVDNI